LQKIAYSSSKKRRTESRSNRNTHILGICAQKPLYTYEAGRRATFMLHHLHDFLMKHIAQY
jgi:hypothetical protein